MKIGKVPPEVLERLVWGRRGALGERSWWGPPWAKTRLSSTWGAAIWRSTPTPYRDP